MYIYIYITCCRQENAPLARPGHEYNNDTTTTNNNNNNKTNNTDTINKDTYNDNTNANSNTNDMNICVAWINPAELT